jgi:hypothetical protein
VRLIFRRRLRPRRDLAGARRSSATSLFAIACGFASVSPQQDEQWLDIVDIGMFAFCEHPLDHLPPDRSPPGNVAVAKSLVIQRNHSVGTTKLAYPDRL